MFKILLYKNVVLVRHIQALLLKTNRLFGHTSCFDIYIELISHLEFYVLINLHNTCNKILLEIDPSLFRAMKGNQKIS